MRAKLEAAVASIYFYLNSAGLPHGLLFTQLLTPLWAWWLLLHRARWLVVVVLVLLPFVVAHALLGIDDVEQYAISLLLLLSALLFGLRVLAFGEDAEALERVLRGLIVSCFALSVLALLTLPTPLVEVLWSYDSISANIYRIPRLTFFTYEASYLSTLLVPLWLWAFLRWLYRPSGRPLLWLGMAALPLILSFSLGILTTLSIVAAVLVVLRLRHVLRHAQTAAVAASVVLAGIMLLVTPNPLSERISNIVRGYDTSGNSRTYISMRLGVQVAEMRSEWWGTGLGQTKVIASEFIRKPQFVLKGQTPRLPNAIAETIATFGWIGLSVRFGLQVWLFFAARVWQNGFQLSLFLVPFIFQFAGSYLVNIAEFVLWALSARRSFPEFDFSSASRATAEAESDNFALPSPMVG